MSSKQENPHAGGGSKMSGSGSPPAKKKLIESNHKFKRMFIDGSLSDITIKAFDRAWKLHKNILAINSPYFMSLFTKDWKDSKEKVLQLRISDQKVSVESLHACLQSMYTFEVEITKANVVSMLAAATFLQLDHHIHHHITFSHEFMIELMGIDSAVDYLGIVATYGGGKAVENAAFECLENCLTLAMFQNELSKIDVELMTKVAASSNLFCGQEGSLYATMVIWLYMKVTGLTFEESVHWKVRIKRANNYFENLKCSIPFLAASAGKPYLEAFRQIRIRDLLITRTQTIASLKRRKIFPNEWIKDATTENWERIEQAMSNTHSIAQDENYFRDNCVRCGVSFGKFQPFVRSFKHALIGLEFIAEKSEIKWTFKIKRINGKIVTIPDEKKAMSVRGRVVKKAQNGKILFTLSSGIKKISLKVGEEVEVLKTEEKLDDCVVNVSINYLF